MHARDDNAEKCSNSPESINKIILRMHMQQNSKHMFR